METLVNVIFAIIIIVIAITRSTVRSAGKKKSDSKREGLNARRAELLRGL